MKTAEQIEAYFTLKRQQLKMDIQEEQYKPEEEQRKYVIRAAEEEIRKLEEIMDDLEIPHRKRKNYYFTFGTCESYPYRRGEYVLVKAYSTEEALKKFRKKFPHPQYEKIINCADYYTEEAWKEKARFYYEGKEPAEVLF